MAKETVHSEMDALKEAFQMASYDDLEFEVILWAMKALQSNPKLTINEAIDIGLDEWIK